MIKGFIGLPRSGKSTLLAKYAKKGFKKYDKVYSNFYIKGCYQLDFDDLGVHLYENALILIDEIALFCDSRNWKNFSKELVYFFTNHGHYKLDIIWCSQSMDADKKIRNMTEELYYIKNFGFGISTIQKIEKGFDFNSDVKDCYTVSGFPKILYRKPYYNMFDSYVKRPLPPNTAKKWSDLDA